MCKKIVLSFFLLLGISAMAQKQAANWYFGWNAGLDFNSGAPIALTDGQLYQNEGCSTISNNQGELFFYTDGIVIYNKNHELMQNGAGLLGSNYSVQSALIVPFPSDSSRYYVFTTDSFGGVNGLNYSIVDMSLDGGLGGVVPSLKNILLETPVTEKLAAVMHKNQQDIWVIAHRVDNNEFIAYLVTGNGISNSPVVSSVGEIHANGEGTMGALKVSPNGKKIACAKYIDGGGLELFDFNTTTGIVSNPQKLNYYNMVAGVEFSPNSKVLYCTSMQYVYQGVYQYDITLPDTQSIQNSETMISSGLYFALQLGIDGKIYVAKYYHFLSAIHDPNVVGANCNFEYNATYLMDGDCVYGLPNFISSYFMMNKILYACTGSSVVLTSRFSNANIYLWYKYDLSTNTYILISEPTSDTLTITDAGQYKVVTNSEIEEIFTVIFSPTPIVDLGPDDSLCGQNNLVLDGTIQNPSDFDQVSYTWFQGNNVIVGETQSTLTITVPGIYSVEVTGEILDEDGNPIGEFCTAIDEIEIISNAPFSVDLGNNPIILCNQNSYLIDPFITGENESNASYLWNTTETTPTITVSERGIYSITVTIDNCSVSESVEIIFNKSPEFDLESDVETCDITALNLILNATPSNFPISETTFEWFLNGVILASETGPTLLADQYGTYAVNAYADDPNCNEIQEITLTEPEPIAVSISSHDDDNLFCVGNIVTLSTELTNAEIEECEFTWFKDGVEIIGETGPGLDNILITEIDAPTNYAVEVTLDQCRANAQIEIGIYGKCIVPQGISPNGDPFNQNLDLSFLDIESLEIFNRYGHSVYKKLNGYSNEWEGRTNEGNPLPSAVYFYVITLENGETFKNKHVLTGWVYLNRQVN